MPGPGSGDWLSDIAKAFQGAPGVPSVDMGQIVAMQRKNMEALTEANQLALEGLQAVIRQQLELTQRTMAQFSEMWSGLFQTGGSMEDRLAKQAEMSKSAFERGVVHARELGDLVSKANSDAIGVLTRRVSETLVELQDYAKKRATG